MFLSLATTYRPATELGFLLHKHPDRVHEAELPFGKALLFYTEATAERCEAALVLDVDPVGLVRGSGRGDGLLDQYVNDRPYAASSFLCVALNKVLRTAMNGTCKTHQALADATIPLEAVVAPLPVRGGGEALVRRLFEPLGWTVTVTPVEPATPPAGRSTRYVKLNLAGEARLATLLAHLYVLIPVLDDAKHYWVGDDEVEKLLARGAGWLDAHPEKDLIVRRYLKHRRALARTALERLDPEAGDEPEREAVPSPEAVLEAPIRLHDCRLDAVATALAAAGATVVADLGCGEGKLLRRLVRERWPVRLIGLDPSLRELETATRRLKLNEPGGPPEGRVTLLHGSLTYRDQRWAEADAAALVEVIEHIDPAQRPLVERVVFGEARPRTVVVTTPNADYNALFETLPAGAMRHPDHRFEWTRAEFAAWSDAVAAAYGYRVAIEPIGDVDAAHGAPSQMAVFTR